MHAFAEFRVDEKYAHLLFRRQEGVRLGNSVRKILLRTTDPRFPRIGQLQKDLRTRYGEPFFYGWDFIFRYNQTELDAGELFKLRFTSTFEPAGEECGTEYDESTACPHCKAGAAQISDLRLDLRKTPRSKDFARTIAGENVISQRLAEIITDAGLTGFELWRVQHKALYEGDPIDLRQVPSGREIIRKAKAAGLIYGTWQFYVWLNKPENREFSQNAWKEYAAAKRIQDRRRAKPLPVWYQLKVTSTSVEIRPPTKTGNEPFDEDEDGQYRCPRGDTLGLNLLSEVYVSRQSYAGSDIAASKQYIGHRSGLLRPERELFISAKFRRILQQEKLTGFKIEIAHLV